MSDIDIPTMTAQNHAEPETLIGHYFRDASRHTLLASDEEKRLAARLMRCFEVVARARARAGDTLETPRTLREATVLLASHSNWPAWTRRATELMRASRELLISSNLRLAVHIARRHAGHAAMVTAMADLIQEANVGLIKAVDRYDPSRGFRFSTYAYWWITEEVRRSLRRGRRVVHTPDHIVDEIRGMQSATMRLHRELERLPRQSELARELEVSPARLSELRGYAATELSTELPVGDESALVLGDTLLQMDDVGGPDRALDSRDRRRVLNRLMADLNEREQAVLSRRFGLGLPSEETLQVISDDLGISRERVRQIEKTALRKLQRMTGERSGEEWPAAPS